MKVQWEIDGKGVYKFVAECASELGVARICTTLQNDGFENERSAVLANLVSFLSDMNEVEIERLRAFLDRDSE